MSYLASYTAALEASIQSAPVPLALSTLIAVGSASTIAATIDTASVAVSAGDFLVAVFCSRRDTTVRTHDSVVPTTWACTFTKRADVDQTDTGTSHHRTSIWTGVASGSGTGILTGTLSGTTFARALYLLRVPGGVAFEKYATGSNEVGTTVSAPWDATPNAAALGIAVMQSEGNPGSMGITSLSAIADTNLSTGSGLQTALFQKLASLPSPLAGTGKTNNAAGLLAGISITGA